MSKKIFVTECDYCHTRLFDNNWYVGSYGEILCLKCSLAIDEHTC